MSKAKNADEDLQDEGLLEDDSHPPCHACATLACVLFFPCVCPCSFFTVSVNEEVLALSCGKFTDHFKEPGVHFKNCCGRELRRISKQKASVNLPNVKIVDKNGNPLIVSGVVVYNIENTRRAALDFVDPVSFVENQALATMKQVVSRYPYEQWDDEAENEDTLKAETEKISEELVKELQRQVSIAGIKVHSFKLNEISYAPEIAPGMLKRQQAEAVVAARQTIVDGAVDISCSAVAELEERGVKLTPEEKARIVSNLLTVICADGTVQPVLDLSY